MMTGFSTAGSKQSYKEFDNVNVKETLVVQTVTAEYASCSNAAVDDEDLMRKGESDKAYLKSDDPVNGDDSTMQFRRDTKDGWDSNSSIVLADGEMGFESNTLKFKIGNGVTEWGDLPYQGTEVDLGTLITGISDNAAALTSYKNKTGIYKTNNSLEPYNTLEIDPKGVRLAIVNISSSDEQTGDEYIYQSIIPISSDSTKRIINIVDGILRVERGSLGKINIINTTEDGVNGVSLNLDIMVQFLSYYGANISIDSITTSVSENQEDFSPDSINVDENVAYTGLTDSATQTVDVLLGLNALCNVDILSDATFLLKNLTTPCDGVIDIAAQSTTQRTIIITAEDDSSSAIVVKTPDGDSIVTGAGGSTSIAYKFNGSWVDVNSLTYK